MQVYPMRQMPATQEQQQHGQEKRRQMPGGLAKSLTSQ
jgi:hypothetical protein